MGARLDGGKSVCSNTHILILPSIGIPMLVVNTEIETLMDT